MDKIREKIETYIKYLSIDSDTKSSKKEKVGILNFIKSLGTDDINSNMYILAELFCKVTSSFETDNIGETEVRQGIIDAFKNIKNIKALDENGQEERRNSYFMVLIFLRKLNNLNDIGSETTVIDENMHYQFEELSETLESMRILFKIEENGEVVFPLAKLLSEVISSEKFKIEALDITTLNTLLLALEVFNMSDYRIQKNKLTQLIEQCNIKCLKYLENSTVMKIDELNWKTNFKKNGVLILADIINHSILIRHESKAYFSNIINTETNYIEDELNSKGIRIASYYEYNYNYNEKFISFEEIIKSKNKVLILEALNLIYNKKNYNVFYKQAFLCHKSKLKVVNPFTINDRYTIKEHNSVTTLTSSVESVTKDCISKYYLEIIEENGLNCACVGLICNLLEIEPLNPSILLSNLDSEKPYQNQIINNWIINTRNPEINLIEIQNKFFSTLRYTSSRRDFDNVQFKGLFLYPIKFDEELVDLIINMKYKFEEVSKYRFYKSKYTTDFNGLSKNIEIEGVKQNNNNVVYHDKDEEFTSEEEFFVIKTSDNNIHVSKLISYLGELREKITIENEKLINYHLIKKITDSQLGFINEFMKLHEIALMSHFHNSISFNSVVKFRLINNILFYRLHNDKRWEIFLKILKLHKKITFENIIDVVHSDARGILYVPKEVNESDSVFSSIVPKYLKNGYARNPDIYYNQLKLVGSKYELRGHKIFEIIILFDTLQSGKSTIRTLDFYFDKYDQKVIDQQPNRTVTYYSEGNPVQLATILKTNNAKLKVVFLNGTLDGEAKIKEYFTDFDGDVEITCLNYFNSKADEDIINLANELYGSCRLKAGNYPIIREFNQPKINVFPEEMLDIEKVFSLFIKKKERMTIL